ncbi:MAG: CPBP family intramembrane metalloprotease [Gemmatimonadaceae bacterium]|nr:CPBP family intramembrane metalloprotease [Gemmatimonadaceae bacterium]
MRCSACAATRARTLYLGLAIALTTALVAPLAWAGWTGAAPAVPAWWHALGALGPTLAAWYAARMEDGAEGVQDWRERVLDVHVGAGWWLAAVALPPVLLGLAVAMVRGWTGDADAAWQSAALAERVATPGWAVDAVLVSALVYGLLEEPGWRGWLYPHLRMSHGPLAATMLLWPMWLVWHVPFFFYRFAFTPAAAGGFAFGLLCGAIVLSWLVEETGSAAPGMAFHVSHNVVMQIAAVAAPAALIGMNILLAVVAAAVVVRWWLVPRRAAVDLADRARAFAGHPTAVLR